MFSLKVRTLSSLAALVLGFVPHASGMPWCGVCAQAAHAGSFTAQSASEIGALGEKKLLYMRLCYSDDAAEPIGATAAENLMAEVNDFFKRHSHGQFSIAATITPLLVLPGTKASYFPVGEDGKQFWLAHLIRSDAREAARQAGYDFEEFDLDMVRFNSPFLQSVANIGMRGAWMVSSHPATTIHEIGHNLGLHHANRWTGPVNGAGSNIEYGDMYDIMGNPPFYKLAGFHFLHKRALGWVSDANTVLVGSSGVYRVYAHDAETNLADRTYALRIRKDDERDYWIEKRREMGEMYDNMLESGLLAYWDDWSGSEGRTQIIDLLGTGESLPVGTPLVDTETDVRIVPLQQAADLSYMDVAVIIGMSGINLLGDWLHFSGEPNQTYSIQRSDDLRTWTEAARRSSASGEIFTRINRADARAFYRVAPLPARM